MNRLQRIFPSILSVIGSALLITGIAMIYVPAAFIAAGLVTTALAIGIVSPTK